MSTTYIPFIITESKEIVITLPITFNHELPPTNQHPVHRRTNDAITAGLLYSRYIQYCCRQCVYATTTTTATTTTDG